MNGSFWLAAAGVGGASGVLAGAFGAHALGDSLAPELLAVFETGARYHLVHSLALFGVALTCSADPNNPWSSRAGWAFLFGIVVFSGSLYLLALTGVRGFGAITPLGGTALILGWLLLIPASRKKAIEFG